MLLVDMNCVSTPFYQAYSNNVDIFCDSGILSEIRIFFHDADSDGVPNGFDECATTILDGQRILVGKHVWNSEDVVTKYFQCSSWFEDATKYVWRSSYSILDPSSVPTKVKMSIPISPPTMVTS